ncbi:hypothetical protein C8Q80DRAFT_798433 [Daedaleopsis nitida]|nr:hypothetical protein C8Q80DRAFT_798433 [Daedaleopsis nitida]
MHRRPAQCYPILVLFWSLARRVVAGDSTDARHLHHCRRRLLVGVRSGAAPSAAIFTENVKRWTIDDCRKVSRRSPQAAPPVLNVNPRPLLHGTDAPSGVQASKASTSACSPTVYKTLAGRRWYTIEPPTVLSILQSFDVPSPHHSFTSSPSTTRQQPCSPI